MQQNAQYAKKALRPAVAVVSAAAAALVITACGPGDDQPATTAAPSAAATAPTAPSTTPAAPVKGGTPSAAPGTAAASSTPSGAAAPTCTPGELKVDAHQAKQRPNGTGTGAAIVAFTNGSAHPCTLEGFPTVAGAANGSPDHNAPLTVTHTGSATPVKLAPGGKAWVKLTFVQVQGEADGYCVSGATPVAYPTLVLGLPGGAGAHQVALDDGLFAECDNKVTTTALLATSPS
ncbi:DUF4232 domain-containing protein [Streptomyces sp. SP17BM10]|uniref:DUF4232 domain-containing protein n=1 Tax=Streptomyces sp. SP17BM10 TaxID=3002530 RepID=UPI002E77322E|nr:DUF4232 domain-containing protein [Streptomyces sp. SP17BM10]MEE1782202.1 DUF4232 domain-containing protein [Streptomyces sp. SP17BM10]